MKHWIIRLFLIVVIVIFTLIYLKHPIGELNTVYILISLILGALLGTQIHGYIKYFILFVYWDNICLMMSLLYIILHVKRCGTNNTISRPLVTNMYSRYFRLLHNFYTIDKQPTIFVCNYAFDRLENPAVIMLPTTICPLIANHMTWVWTTVVDHVIIKEKGSNQYLKVREKIWDMYNNNISVLVYVEKPHTHIGNGVGTLHSGIFRIAQSLGISITPVVIDRVCYTPFGMLRKQNFQICVGTPFIVRNIEESVYKTRIFMRTNMDNFIKTKYDLLYEPIYQQR